MNAESDRVKGPPPGDLQKAPRDEMRRAHEREVMERVLDEVDEERGQEESDRC